MLYKLKSTYGEIAKFFPELAKRLSSPDCKKKKLMKMIFKNRLLIKRT